MTDIHTIQAGETMTTIAATHGIKLNELLAINPHIDDADIIFAGQPINVPTDDDGIRTTDVVISDADLPTWFNIAQQELGTVEYAGPAHNPRIIEYHATTTLKAPADEVPWCSSFVNWCIKDAGLAGTNSAAARSWLKWGKKLTKPKRGCIVIYSSSRGPASGHVGFFDRIDNNHIITLGGNQQNTVNYSSYPLSRLLGYRWPS